MDRRIESPESIIEIRCFLRRDMVDRHPGRGEKPIAPRWLCEGVRSIQKLHVLRCNAELVLEHAPRQSAAVCWYSGTPTRRPFGHRADRPDPFSQDLGVEKLSRREIGRPTQRSSPFDLAIDQRENDISDTSKSAKRKLSPEEFRGCTQLGMSVIASGFTLP